MNIKQIKLIGFFVALATSACFGQLEKTIHQTFDLEGKTAIHLNIHGQYSIIAWAGNNVLVETKVQLYNSSSSILKHFVEKDLRYQVDADTSSTGTLQLLSHDKKRVSLRTKTGAESTEVVETKVYVPENFIIKDDKTLVIKE